MKYHLITIMLLVLTAFTSMNLKPYIKFMDFWLSFFIGVGITAAVVGWGIQLLIVFALIESLLAINVGRGDLNDVE